MAALAVAAGLSLFASAPGHAAGLLQTWQAARDADPDLRVAHAQRAERRALAAQAPTLWAPQVELSATVGIARSQTSVDGAAFSAPGFGTTDAVAFRTAVDGGSGRIAIAARQPLWSPERQALARQLGLAGDLAEIGWQAAEQAAMLRTAERWLEVALAAEALALARSQQTAVERALAEATDRWRVGDAPVTGTHEARARAEAVRAHVLAAQADLQVRTHALADLTGQTDARGPGGVPKEWGPDDTPVPGLQAWLDAAAADNPGLRMQALAVEQARAQAEQTARSASPRVELVAQAARDRVSGSGDYGSASSSATQALVGVQLSVPLYTGGAIDARHVQALRAADLAQAELERARRQVAQQVRTAWLGLDVAAGRIAALEQARIASQSRLGATRTGVQVGDRTTLDLLNAQNDLAQADWALAQARVALQRDRLRLAALAARLDEAQLARIDASLNAVR